MAATGSVLLIEDDANDVILIRRACRLIGIPNRLVSLSNARQAINYLLGRGVYANRFEYPFPALVLLDLDLPVMDGFQFLEWLRREPEIGSLPVIVLTASVFSPDIAQAYALGANSFLVKPTDSAALAAMLKSVAEYWLNTCELPPGIPVPPREPKYDVPPPEWPDTKAA